MFTKEDVFELAEISHLDISRCDIFELQAALDNNLTYVSQIKEVNVDDIETLTKIEEEI